MLRRVHLGGLFYSPIRLIDAKGPRPLQHALYLASRPCYRSMQRSLPDNPISHRPFRICRRYRPLPCIKPTYERPDFSARLDFQSGPHTAVIRLSYRQSSSAPRGSLMNAGNLLKLSITLLMPASAAYQEEIRHRLHRLASTSSCSNA